MRKQSQTTQRAKVLSKDRRKRILMSFGETELHGYLKELFQAMEPDYTIEIIHEAGELGKDLVLVNKDRINIDVIGVVVKTGHIRGRTVGVVDEITSQVEQSLPQQSDHKIKQIESQVLQAQAHPAQMRTIFRKLPITKVLIVLAGELSKPARQRLLAELEGPKQIFDIEWLIENFTNYYPQVFFEGNVMDFLEQKIEELETKKWLPQRTISLSEYFVEPTVATIDIPVKFDEVNLALIIGKRRMPFSYLRSILKQHRKVMLVGDPGVGKSAALAKLKIDMLKEASGVVFKGGSKRRKLEIPIFIEAKDMLSFENPAALENKFFATPDVRQRFKVHAMMVDALDEVPASQRRDVIQRAEAFSKELACCLVITSRKIDIVETAPIGFAKYELLPFELGQALKLFQNLVTNKKTLDALKDGFDKIKFQIPMVPLSLMLLIQLVEEKKEIPASATELYDRFFDMALGRFDTDKGIQALFEYRAKKLFLAELAFREFHKKGRLEVPENEFRQFLENYANKYNWDNESLEVFVKEIDRAGIIAIRQSIVFRHRSFLDYFVAFYIFDKREEFEDLNNLIVQIYFDEVWADVAFFYVGLLTKVNYAVLNKILEFKEEGLFPDMQKFLSGRLLQAGWHSPTKTKSYGIKQSLAFGPLIRQRFLDGAKKVKVNIPRIFADFIVLTLADLSFGSIFLSKESRSLLDDLCNQPTKQSVYLMLPLLWSVRRFLRPDEIERSVDAFLQALSEVPDFSAEEQVRCFLLLWLIHQKDRAIVKTIKRKLDRLKKRHPKIFAELLPHRKKGFRR